MPEPRPPEARAEDGGPGSGPASGARGGRRRRAHPRPRRRPLPAVPERTAVIETPLYRAVVSSAGGKFKEWELHYRGDEADDRCQDVAGPRGWRSSASGRRRGRWRSALDGEDRPRPSSPDRELRTGRGGGFGFASPGRCDSARKLLVEHELKVENRNTVAQGVELAHEWSAPGGVAEGSGAVRRGAADHVVRLPQGTDRRTGTISPKAADDQRPRTAGSGSRAGSHRRPSAYPLRYSRNKASARARRRKRKASPGTLREVGLKIDTSSLAPGKPGRVRSRSTSGPRSTSDCKSLGVGLEKPINFGGFPVPPALRRPADGVARRADPLAHALVLLRSPATTAWPSSC